VSTLAGRKADATAARTLVAFVARDVVFAALFALLVAASWAALWLWSASPYARYLEHPGWGDAASLGAFCRDVVVPAGGHALAWVLMVAAMMLPTTYPLLAMFRRIADGRPDRARLVALVVAGFLAVWLGFGLVAHLLDAGVRAAATRSGFLVQHGWAIAALVLAGAGAFQFSALKYRCLEACRAPFAFVASRWHGRSPAREAFRLGVDHGAFCVGCCWALMLVMFVVGVGSVGWMLALAAVMAAEKNLPGGRRLRTPLGAALIGWAAFLVAANS
jgi:predicted metal-binding membrane protein